MLAADHLVKHGSCSGRSQRIQAAGPHAHLLRLLFPSLPRHTPISTAPESVGVFFFLLKTKQKIRIQGDLPIRLKVVSIS